MVRIHIADEMVGMVQKCRRCGEILIDYTHAAELILDPSKSGTLSASWGGWACGAYIRVDGNFSMVVDQDAVQVDESKCLETVQ